MDGMNDVRITKRIRVYGIVQAVGFRPTVSRHAMSSGVKGTVCNKGPYVEIFIQGNASQVDEFIKLLSEKPPKRAVLLKVDILDIEDDMVFESFDIIESEKTKGTIFVSPDIAICDDCKEEMYNPKDRRYLHPFINCTCCGPRLTILDSVPYDRERTSMKDFPMCPDCAEEYYSPETRRYDAQPVCCNDCGPEVSILGTDIKGREAIIRIREMILEGKIVAIKGIGGFHLCCNATDEKAVSLLRLRKNRPVKPFAVMARDIEAAEKACIVTPEAREILTGHQKPIILMEKNDNAVLAESIAPGNPNVGIMLPYAPVQLLLFDYDDGLKMPDFLVMTSANESGAPICRNDEDAISELGDLCDAILTHNRPILIRADDTVMSMYDSRPYMVRRSRGYAPLPISISKDFEKNVLAVGGELKNSFCIRREEMLYMSPYVGDLTDFRTVKAMQETIGRFRTLLETEPEEIICDLHPKYNSTMVGEELAKQMNIPLRYVQHHYAHVLSCMAENDYHDKVIGVSYDGTGYGSDGTIWGGEILLSDRKGFERAGHIRPFSQIGGDASSKEGWRIAGSMLNSIYGSEKAAEMIEKLNLCDKMNAKFLLHMAEKNINSIKSTSAGRLFDAVSAVLNIKMMSTFEGEASMSLQFAAEEFAKKNDINETAPFEFDYTEQIAGEDGSVVNVMQTEKLFAYIAEEYLSGRDAGELAWIFHERLAEMTVRACENIRNESGVNAVALSGGVFQNLLLLKMTDEKLENKGFTVLKHSLIPPNDGGIAIGQSFHIAGN